MVLAHLSKIESALSLSMLVEVPLLITVAYQLNSIFYQMNTVSYQVITVSYQLNASPSR